MANTSPADSSLEGVPPAEAVAEQTVHPESVTDVRVAGAAVSPAFAPAGAELYLGTARRGIEIPVGSDPAEQLEKVIKYATKLFPDASFSYLGEGRYGIVLADGQGRAYKVCRSAHRYSRTEKEAGALQVLSKEGLAPRLHLLADAGEEYRIDKKPYVYRGNGFGGVSIPRQNSGHELPVLVMDAVDTAPLKDAEPAKLAEAFRRAADVCIREEIVVSDTEIRIDRSTGRVIVLDVSELSQVSHDDQSPDYNIYLPGDVDAGDVDVEILRRLIFDFGLRPSEREIVQAYREGGLEGVYDKVFELKESSPQKYF